MKKNWAREVAVEVAHQYRLFVAEERDFVGDDEIQDIIYKYCPFKVDTAYEEVGETSRKLDEIKSICLTIKRGMR